MFDLSTGRENRCNRKEARRGVGKRLDDKIEIIVCE